MAVPGAGKLDYARLRVGVSRPAGSDHRASVELNGTPLPAALEDCAPRIETEKLGYGSCKIIDVPVALLKTENAVTVSFPDGKPGSVGSVIIRAGLLR